MTPDHETPQRRGWFEPWLEPRWRALITWMALAAIMGVIIFSSLIDHLENAFDFMMASVTGAAPVWLTPFRQVILIANFVPLAVWYQPLLLRLGLVRWLIWMGGATLTVVALLAWAIDTDRWEGSLMFWLWPSLGGLLLIGRRSRPWMSLVAGILSFIVGRVFSDGWDEEAWWWLPVSNLPYAAIMLYGTRRLPDGRVAALA